MKKIMLLLLIIPVFYSLQSCNDPQKKPKNYNQETDVDESGLAFINNALDGGRTEIELSKKALRVSQNPRVKAFAKMMITDHTKAAMGLSKLMNKNDVSPEYTISAVHKRMIDSISKFTGADFDKAYMHQMVIDHKQTVLLFKDGSRDRINTVQNYAQNMLPIIGMHLDSAKAIEASLR